MSLSKALREISADAPDLMLGPSLHDAMRLLADT